MHGLSGRRAWLGGLAAVVAGWFGRAEAQGGGYRPSASGGGVSGSGTANRLAKFTAGGTIGNSILADNGTAELELIAGHLLLPEGAGPAPSLSFKSNCSLGLAYGGTTTLWVTSNCQAQVALGFGALGVKVAANEGLNWSSGNNVTGSSDVGVRRNAAGVVEPTTGSASAGATGRLLTEKLLTSFNCATAAGNVTQNTSSGIATIENGASSVVISNSLVTSCTVAMAVLGSLDVTAVAVRAVIVDDGDDTITIHVNAGATADTCVLWWLVN